MRVHPLALVVFIFLVLAFRYSGVPLQNQPHIFACLGRVVGLYGIIYLEVARVPERGWLLAAVGLVGKVLGPIGLLRLIWSGTWPLSTIVLSLTNDLIWWFPFALYLIDAWPAFRQDVFRERVNLGYAKREHSLQN